MYETLEDMREQGYNVDKLTPTHNKNDILWDSVRNQFVLVMENNEYYTGTNFDDYENVDKTTLWKIYKDMPESSEYSIYYAGDATVDELELNAIGFDAGNNKNIKEIVYKNDKNISKNIVIRTNSINTELTVTGYIADNGKGDIVSHYGSASSVEIVKCANESYHEYGKIGYVEIAEGHFVAENNSSVRALVATSENVKVDSNNGKISLSYAKTQEIKENHTGNVELEYIYTSETINSVKSLATFCEEGIGTKDDPFMIGQDTFANIQTLDTTPVKDLGKEVGTLRYYKLIEDIDFSTIKKGAPNQPSYLSVNSADIDLNGKTIYNLDIFLVTSKNYLNIYNGKVNCIENGALVFCFPFANNPDSITIKDITFYGNVNNVNTVIGLTSNTKNLVIKNVTSYVNIKVDNTEGLVGGLISNLSSTTKTTLTNCKVYGDITTNGTSASGLINGISLNMDNITITNCHYYGNIKTAEDGKSYEIAPGYEG